MIGRVMQRSKTLGRLTHPSHLKQPMLNTRSMQPHWTAKRWCSDTSNTTASLRRNLDHTLFSWSKQKEISPILAHSAKGVYVTDTLGKNYLDFSSQLMNVNLGHNHPYVMNAMKDQIDKLAYVHPGFATEARGKLGEKLAQIAPGDLNKTFFTNGGADANESAIKLARLITGKEKIITRYRSYHGASHSTMNASGDPRKFATAKQNMPGFIHVEDPACYRDSWSALDAKQNYNPVAYIERLIQYEGPDSIAAILMEGASGSSGCIPYPKNFWPKLRELADKYNIMLIADEVMSGFGRTGKWFAIDHDNVTPDMIVIAKGLTSGYIPMGGVIVSDKISKHFDHTPLPIGLTYSSHPLACATALACLEVYESENIIEKSHSMGQYLTQELSKLAEKHPSIVDTRNAGLLGCIELILDHEAAPPLTPWHAPESDAVTMNLVARSLRDAGLHTFVRWNMIFVAPPLTITTEEMDKGLAIISKALEISDWALSDT